MPAYGYWDRNKTAVTERKGALRNFWLEATKDEAKAACERVRRRGFRAKFFERSVQADGLAILVYVVVSREQSPSRAEAQP